MAAATVAPPASLLLLLLLLLSLALSLSLSLSLSPSLDSGCTAELLEPELVELLAMLLLLMLLLPLPLLWMPLPIWSRVIELARCLCLLRWCRRGEAVCACGA